MASLPPICLRGYFSTIAVNGNDYTVTVNQIDQQRYSSTTNTSLFYTGNDVQPGMYASSNLDGKIFRIKSLTSKTATSITGIFEDVDGLNKRFDAGGSGAGNPADTFGYIFQLNSDGLPLLTRVDSPLSTTYTDSILARFLYSRSQPLTENFCVLTGSGTNTLAITYDGNTFTGLGNSVFTSVAIAVAYNGRIWVAVGNGGTAIATSSDGINWTRRTSTLTTGRSVAWNGSIWVVVGYGGRSTVVTSPDGIDWTDRGKPIATEGYSVIWDGSKFVAGGRGTTATDKLIQSSNGITWEAINFTSLSEIYTLASSGLRLIVGGRQTTTTLTTTTLFYSNNAGITWLPTVSSYSGQAGIALSYATRSIAWNGSIWVAVGNGITQTQGQIDGFISIINTSRSIATSTDGIYWTGQLNNFFPTSGGYGIAWNGRKWIAGGEGSSTSIITSTDGINWTDAGKSVFTTTGNGIASRYISLPIEPIPTFKSVEIYVRGTGLNQLSNPLDLYSYCPRIVSVNRIDVAQTSGVSQLRGLSLTIIDAVTLNHVSTTNYDTNSRPVDSSNLANAITTLTHKQIGILASWDAWETSVTDDLRSAALRVGLTELGRFTKVITLPPRRPYASIFYGNYPPWTPIMTNVTRSGTSFTFTKTGGANLWGDASFYSLEGFTGGASVSATVPVKTSDIMFGLSTSPALSSSYTTISYAIYFRGNGFVDIWENNIGSPGGQIYVANDVFSVTYTGKVVEYRKNGVLFRTSGTIPAVNTTFYLDTSFYTLNSVLNNVTFTQPNLNNLTGTRNVIERMEPTSGKALFASIQTTITTDGTDCTINGATSTNALYSADSNTVEPSVSVDSLGVVNVDGRTEIRAAGPVAALTSTGLTSQLTVYAKDNPNSRLYIGNYYTAGVNSFSVIQSSDVFTNNAVLRDNPINLSLNPLLGADGLPGQVAIGRTNAAKGIALDVNGYIQGKGSIVNTVLLSAGTGVNWIAYSQNILICQTTYKPIQTGTVNILVHASAELTFTTGSGFDGLSWQVSLYKPVTILRIFDDAFNTYFMFSESDFSKLSVGSVIHVVGSYSTYPLNVLAGGSPFTVLQKFTIYTLSGTTTTVGYVIRITVNQNLPRYSLSTPISVAANIFDKTIQKYNQNFDSNNVTGRMSGSNVFGVGTSHVSISETTLIGLQLIRGGDDQGYYKNAYLTLHEISNS